MKTFGNDLYDGFADGIGAYAELSRTCRGSENRYVEELGRAERSAELVGIYDEAAAF